MVEFGISALLVTVVLTVELRIAKYDITTARYVLQTNVRKKYLPE